MDLLLYLLVMITVGLVKTHKTRYTEVISTSVIDEECDIPPGSNLALIQEPDAFTLILKELGLK